MPSGEHESPIELVKDDPGLMAWVLANVLGVDVPQHHHVRPYATDVRMVVPHTYHADSMSLFCDEDDRPLFSVVFEVQRDGPRAKLRAWKLYVADFEMELDVTCLLVIYCPDPAHARHYRRLAEADRATSVVLRPYFLTPADIPVVTQLDVARDNPALAVFSALCHGGEPVLEDMFPALMEALRAVGQTKAISYYDIVLSGLPLPARTRWEAFMTMTVGKYRSELFQQIAAEGQALGEAESILTVLDERGIAVPEAVRQQILGCTDLTRLQEWLRRAIKADTVEDVLAP